MFDHRHYVPLLKAKEGELRALLNCPASAKDHFTPLLEVIPVPWDFVEDQPAKTIDAHLAPLPQKIANCWGARRHIFIDCDLVAEERLANDQHPLTAVIDGMRARGVVAVPVTGLRRDDEYQAAVANAVSTGSPGVCLRLISEDFDQLEPDNVRALMRRLNVRPEQVDVIVDFASITDEQVGALTVAARAVISMLAQIENWGSLTIAASGFPADVGEVAANTIGSLPRAGWHLWQQLLDQQRHVRRMPTFGDYAVAHPELREIDPRIMVMSANIRYTSDDEWLIFKGRSVRSQGFQQFVTLCQTIVGRPEYRGPTFSWGDEYIMQCANQQVGTGNATTWRTVATNHHIMTIIEQIANQPEL